MVPDLVGDHVGLGESAAGASGIAGTKSPLQLLEEQVVEIDLLIDRTIERPVLDQK
jgi:hypothetical protein